MSNLTNATITNDAGNQTPLPNRRYYWNNLELLEVNDVLAYAQARVQAAAIPVIRTKQHATDAIKVCNALADVVGDDEQHPLFKMMDDLMTAIGVWEDADPELQAFFNSGDVASAEQLTQVGMRLAHTGSEHQPSELGAYTGPVEVEYHNGTKQTANVGAIDWHRVVAYRVPEGIAEAVQCQGNLTQCPTCDNVTARSVGVNPQPSGTPAD